VNRHGLLASLRPMNLDDIPVAMRLKGDAGWNQTEADWRRLITTSPDGCFAAVGPDDSIVGTVTTITYAGRLSWVGMVLVAPHFRHRGIGTALLERAIAYLDARGVRSVKLDATPAGKPLYERLGFVSEYDVERWSLQRPHVDAVTAFERIKLDDVLSWDRQVFGVDRSALLLSFHREGPQFSLVARKGSELEGYAFGRRGSLADQLGPWVAVSEAAAAVTLDEFLRRSPRGTLFVDCMNRTVWSRSLVKSRGFTFVRPLTRMYRGSNDYPGVPELVFGISGPEFG
jgi:GNAT superfamily N-acetyltransferase